MIKKKNKERAQELRQIKENYENQKILVLSLSDLTLA